MSKPEGAAKRRLAKDRTFILNLPYIRVGGQVSQPLPEKRRLRIGTFTEVVASRQAYLRILYLLLAFPLGLFYFVFLTVALSAGVATLVIGVGIVILLGALFVSRGFVVFERKLAASMLGADIPAPQPQRVPVQRLWLR